LKAIAGACPLCAPQAEQAKLRKGPIMTAVCSQCGDRCGRTSAAAMPSMWAPENRNREARDADARGGSKAEKLDLCAAGAPSDDERVADITYAIAAVNGWNRVATGFQDWRASPAASEQRCCSIADRRLRDRALT
jgi:hypothetical protein